MAAVAGVDMPIDYEHQTDYADDNGQPARHWAGSSRWWRTPMAFWRRQHISEFMAYTQSP